MYKTASEIADSVLAKVAEQDREFLDHFPGSLINSGLLTGGFSGALLAGFSPRAAKYIPNDKLRVLAGLGAGALVGGSGGAAGTALANYVSDRAKRDAER